VRFLLSLIALLWGASAGAEATFLGSYSWDRDERSFGGFSGLEVVEDGNHFTALSDRGSIVRGAFIRTDGLITGVEAGPIILLRDSIGHRFARHKNDTEGLAIAADGTIAISFERTHSLRILDPVSGNMSRAILHPRAGQIQRNASLEALAVGPDGAFYTLPERSGRANWPFEVMRWKDGEWTYAFDIPRRGVFLPVGADIGPDGRFYLLERDFMGVGFRNRVRRFDLAGGAEETILQTGVGGHDNLEGISVWHDGTKLRLTLISDDNFQPLQETLFVEYRLTE
jgi:hypothetical protein